MRTGNTKLPAIVCQKGVYMDETGRNTLNLAKGHQQKGIRKRHKTF